MDVGHPETALAPGLEGEVAVVLAKARRPLTGREVARLARRGSQSAIAATLRRLAQHGLVDVQEAGRSLLYTLNTEHLLAETVLALGGLRSELVARLRAAIATWDPPPESACLFGSTARGDGGIASDIDVLVVRPDAVDEENEHWREQVEELASAVERWTGNRAAIVELSERQRGALAKRRDRLSREIARDSISLLVPGARVRA